MSKPKKNNELVETNESQIILEVASDGYHYAKFLVTTIGERNANGRVYPESVIARELSQPMRNDILGQDTHPMMTPKFTEQFLIWNKFMRDGNKEYAVAKVVPTDPDGKNFILLAQAGAMASCSRRGRGSVKEGKVNGEKCMIVQDDYRIEGIDILPPHTQSDPNAYLTHFEAIEPTENETNMEELTLEQLREERGDLVEEITKPLEEKVAELETTVADTNTKLEAATILAQEQETKLTESQVKIGETVVKLTETETKLAEVSEQFAALGESAKQASESVNALTEQLNVAKQERDQLESKLQAQAHLREKVKGEKAAWFILEELVDVATVAEVDAKFEQAKQNGDKLIENLGAPQGRAVYQGNENQELTEEEKKEKQDNAILQASKQVAKRVGV